MSIPKPAGVVLAAFLGASCGSSGSSPLEPTESATATRIRVSSEGVTYESGAPVALPASVGDEGPGLVFAQNGAPTMVLKTTPRLDESTTPPTMRGVAPLTARFNLCESWDPEQNLENPEQGDTLNWQFHFGDSDTPPFAEDGTFNPDAEHFCRTEHTYEEGVYTATVSVTDKHLEDQASDVVATARVTRQIRVEAVGEAVDAPAAPECVAGTSDVIPAGGKHTLVITASSGSALVRFVNPPADVTATYTRLNPPQAPIVLSVTAGALPHATITLHFRGPQTWQIEFQDGGSPSGTPYDWLTCP